MSDEEELKVTEGIFRHSSSKYSAPDKHVGHAVTCVENRSFKGENQAFNLFFLSEGEAGDEAARHGIYLPKYFLSFLENGIILSSEIHRVLCIAWTQNFY